jgi:hypothetical protein
MQKVIYNFVTNLVTWDVSNVLGYLRKLSPIKFISLKDLTLKLVMLIAIIKASRVKSLHLLGLNLYAPLINLIIIALDPTGT